MNATTPITFTTPDGVERTLRFTLGARKRIQDRFGMNLLQALNAHGDGALPEIAFALMFDEEGDPPKDLSVKRLAEALDSDHSVPLMAAIMSSITKGQTSKKEIEALLLKAAEEERMKLATELTGSTYPASASSASEPQETISGGDTSNVKSSPKSNGSTKSNGTASDSSPSHITSRKLSGKPQPVRSTETPTTSTQT